MTSEEKARWAANFPVPKTLVEETENDQPNELRVAKHPHPDKTLEDISIIRPFDPHTEISAGDRYIAGIIIVKHLWIIFVLLPLVLVILFEILTAR